jgi:hypothetical protein
MAVSTDLIPQEGPTCLVALEEACRWLATAKSLDEVKALRDAAQSFTEHAKRREYGIKAQNDGAEIKVRAERHLGVLLAEKKIADGGNFVLPPKTLRIESSRWQRLASIPAEVFDGHIAEVRGANKELTTAGLLRLGKELEQVAGLHGRDHLRRSALELRQPGHPRIDGQPLPDDGP